MWLGNKYNFIFSIKKKRFFNKISFKQFVEDFKCTSIDIYNSVKLPRRATRRSAGYDFYSPFDITLNPNETIKILTGVKVFMQSNEVLFLYPRSSVGFNYKVRLDNTVGVIDSDYYNNCENEGHISIKLTNTGDKTWHINAGEAFCQGVFQKFLLTDDDNPVSEDRIGGIGSTNGEKGNK